MLRGGSSEVLNSASRRLFSAAHRGLKWLPCAAPSAPLLGCVQLTVHTLFWGGFIFETQKGKGTQEIVIAAGFDIKGIAYIARIFFCFSFEKKFGIQRGELKFGLMKGHLEHVLCQTRCEMTSSLIPFLHSATGKWTINLAACRLVCPQQQPTQSHEILTKATS